MTRRISSGEKKNGQNYSRIKTHKNENLLHRWRKWLVDIFWSDLYRRRRNIRWADTKNCSTPPYSPNRWGYRADFWAESTSGQYNWRHRSEFRISICNPPNKAPLGARVAGPRNKKNRETFFFDFWYFFDWNKRKGVQIHGKTLFWPRFCHNSCLIHDILHNIFLLTVKNWKNTRLSSWFGMNYDEILVRKVFFHQFEHPPAYFNQKNIKNEKFFSYRFLGFPGPANPAPRGDFFRGSR